MSWHEYIDDTLTEVSLLPRSPRNLTLGEPLRAALGHVVGRRTSDPVTFRAAKAMADCAIDPMVADLAETDHPYVDELQCLRGWRDQPVALFASTHSRLVRVAGIYREGKPQLGIAISSAAHMMTKVYPIDYENPVNPVNGPLEGDMLHLVGLFAVTSHVHANECGPEKNQAAIEALAQTITQITTTE